MDFLETRLFTYFGMFESVWETTGSPIEDMYFMPNWICLHNIYYECLTKKNSMSSRRLYVARGTYFIKFVRMSVHYMISAVMFSRFGCLG